MTTIIFATKPATENFVALADTQTTFGSEIIRGADGHSKIITPSRAEGLLFGCAGHVSVSSSLKSLQIQSKLKKNPTQDDADSYVYNVVLPAMKAHLKSHLQSVDDRPSYTSMHILLWLMGTDFVYEISDDFAVVTHESGFYTVGSGSVYARSSFKIRPEAEIEDHMRFAEESDIYTSGPFHKVVFQ